MARHARTPLLLAALALLAPGWPAADAQAKHPHHRRPTRHAHHHKRTAHRPSSAFLRGVNIGYGGSAADDASEIAAAKSLHAQAVRVEIRWSALEPERGRIAPGPLAAVDDLMSAAGAAGIKVLALVEGTPCWASSAPAPIAATCVPEASGAANAWPPSEPAAYGAFTAYLARRYAGELAAIEVWNEPDYSGEDYFAGPDKAGHYAAVLKAAYPAIKAVDPALPVLGGAFVGPNGAFLRALYTDGIRGYYDGLAVHFYTLTLAALQDIHETQVRHHDSKPLWLTEVGWPACWPQASTEAEQACVTPQVQAENLVNLTRSLARTAYVHAELFYKLRDYSGEDFGVLDAAGAPRPSFAAVAGAFASPFQSPAPVRLRLRAHAGQLTASGSTPAGDYLELEAFKHGRLRYRTIFVPERFNRYSLALPRALGTRHLRVRVYQYGLSPGSGAERRL